MPYGVHSIDPDLALSLLQIKGPCIQKKTCFGYSLEVPHSGTFNEYPHFCGDLFIYFFFLIENSIFNIYIWSYQNEDLRFCSITGFCNAQADLG